MLKSRKNSENVDIEKKNKNKKAQGGVGGSRC